MAMRVLDRDIQEQIIADRRARGIDHHDEVWDGVYVMSPLANDEHQDLVGEFDSIFRDVIQRAGRGKVRPGVNVSDRATDWKQNYRCPDVVVYLNGTRAVNHGAFWEGGPDFLVEIVSEGDRARDKLPFYALVGTREGLIVDRNPWMLELYRLDTGRLAPVGRATVEGGESLASEVLPLSFRLVVEEIGARPRIEVRRTDTGQTWRV